MSTNLPQTILLKIINHYNGSLSQPTHQEIADRWHYDLTREIKPLSFTETEWCTLVNQYLSAYPIIASAETPVILKKLIRPNNTVADPPPAAAKAVPVSTVPPPPAAVQDPWTAEILRQRAQGKSYQTVLAEKSAKEYNQRRLQERKRLQELIDCVHEAFPKYISLEEASPEGTSALLPFVTTDGTRYLLALTQIDCPIGDELISTDLTVHPYATFKSAPETVIAYFADGGYFRAIATSQTSKRKFFARAIVHKPGRKFRCWTTNKDGNVPELSTWHVMLDKAPWFESISESAWLNLPTIDTKDAETISVPPNLVMNPDEVTLCLQDVKPVAPKSEPAAKPSAKDRTRWATPAVLQWVKANLKQAPATMQVLYDLLVSQHGWEYPDTEVGRTAARKQFQQLILRHRWVLFMLDGDLVRLAEPWEAITPLQVVQAFDGETDSLMLAKKLTPLSGSTRYNSDKAEYVLSCLAREGFAKATEQSNGRMSYKPLPPIGKLLLGIKDYLSASTSEVELNNLEHDLKVLFRKPDYFNLCVETQRGGKGIKP